MARKRRNRKSNQTNKPSNEKSNGGKSKTIKRAYLNDQIFQREYVGAWVMVSRYSEFIVKRSDVWKRGNEYMVNGEHFLSIDVKRQDDKTITFNRVTSKRAQVIDVSDDTGLPRVTITLTVYDEPLPGSTIERVDWKTDFVGTIHELGGIVPPVNWYARNEQMHTINQVDAWAIKPLSWHVETITMGTILRTAANGYPLISHYCPFLPLHEALAYDDPRITFKPLTYRVKTWKTISEKTNNAKTNNAKKVA